MKDSIRNDELDYVEVITDGSGAAWVAMVGDNPYIFVTDDPGNAMGSTLGESALPNFAVIDPDLNWVEMTGSVQDAYALALQYI